MIFVTTYRTKPFMSRDEVKELMEIFATNGPGPGTTAHYIAVDGSHGVVVSETDDVGGSYASILPYAPYVEYETSVMLSIDDAVPHIVNSLA